MSIGRLRLVALDCPDALGLAEFYAGVTGWELEVPDWLDVEREGLRWVQLRSPEGATLAFQQIADHVAPTWPGGDRPQQLHLDFEVDDLDEAEAAVLAIGARKADVQPDPDEYRVFLDPVGHPFCLCLDQ
jgi:catechol 2,3-dioxygenase-like lactoylglutathione lyase family enzyme